MAKWDLVIFDLDGTLIDTIGDLGDAVNFAMSTHMLPIHTEDEFKFMVGNGVRKLVERAIPANILKGDPGILNVCLSDFMEYYSSHIDIHSHPYDGMVELLKDLSGSGTAVAVASNKFQAGTEQLIRRFYSEIHFCAIFGDCDERPLKPDPSVIYACTSCVKNGDDSKVTALRVAMVGDSSTDIKTALAAGVTPIGVTWGFRPESELISAGAEFIAHSPFELCSILL